jgi:hypothetical protein
LIAADSDGALGAFTMQPFQLGGYLIGADDEGAEVDRAVVFDGDGELPLGLGDRFPFGHRQLHRHAVHYHRHDHHEDDQQNQADVDEWCDVDIRLEHGMRSVLHGEPPAGFDTAGALNETVNPADWSRSGFRSSQVPRPARPRCA